MAKVVTNTRSLDKMTQEEALEILRLLCKDNDELSQQVEKTFNSISERVDVEEVTDSVLSDLEFIDMDEVYKNSGADQYGYTDPGEAAQMLVEDALKPYLEKMEVLILRETYKAGMSYCMAIVSALYQFEENGESELLDLIEAPSSMADDIYDSWKKSCKDDGLKATMKEFTANIKTTSKL